MQDKVTILFLVDKDYDWQYEKAKLMMLSFIDKNSVLSYTETKENLTIESDTHHIRVVKLSQSPRGYRANFIIDFTGFEDCVQTAYMKSTYSWTHGEEVVSKQLVTNGWISE